MTDKKPKPIRINPKKALKAVREAWNQKRLGAQDPRVDQCQYRYADGGCCAIGAMLTEEQAAQLKANGQNGYPLDWLTKYELVKIPEGWNQAFNELQRKHDGVCGAHGDYRKQLLAEFEAHLTTLEQKVA